jgi:2-desacetyl-2-hydroxyethyl bacteriochlorophyllide A dehydrogenase
MALVAPDDVPSDNLALTEPFAVAVRAVRRSRLGLGDRVAVLGGGAIGLAVLQVAQTAGCATSVLVDPVPARRDLAGVLGAAEVASHPTDLLDTDLGASFDVVFDCTGIAEVPAQAAQLVRAGGRVVLVGIAPEPGKIDYKSLVLREVSLIGTVGHVFDEDTRAAVALIATGRVEVAPMVTHRLPLERAVEDGFAFLAGPGRTTAIKVLVSPHLAATGDPSS